jgi:antitoxin component of MazEF toxin-antitoxin module
MRLQKQVSRKFKDKEYSKFVVVIPQHEIEKLEWNEGQELEPEINGKKLILKPKKSGE